MVNCVSSCRLSAPPPQAASHPPASVHLVSLVVLQLRPSATCDI